MSSNDLRIGVDLGGTKIEAVAVLAPAGAAVDPSSPAVYDVLTRRRIATEREHGYQHILARTADLARAVAREAGVDVTRVPIGVGMPGSYTFRQDGGARSDVPLVKNSNTVCLNGMPFQRDLATLLGNDVAVANDANCFALAEATWGAARGARVSFGVILGTGVGAGVVLRGPGGRPEAWEGRQSIAGEWGHVPLDPVNGPPCYCGLRGCIETYLSGPSIERRYRERSGDALGVAAIALAARSGTDAHARAVMDETIDVFGRSLATVLNVLDPDVVVLGGGVSNLDELYVEGREAVVRWVFNDALVTRIERHQLGDSAGVLGAALLPAAR